MAIKYLKELIKKNKEKELVEGTLSLLRQLKVIEELNNSPKS